jgi:hypothetical protein
MRASVGLECSREQIEESARSIEAWEKNRCWLFTHMFLSQLAPAKLWRANTTETPPVTARVPSRLLRQPQLLHEVLAVPEQPFVVHRAALPVADRCHAKTE